MPQNIIACHMHFVYTFRRCAHICMYKCVYIYYVNIIHVYYTLHCTLYSSLPFPTHTHGGPKVGLSKGGVDEAMPGANTREGRAPAHPPQGSWCSWCRCSLYHTFTSLWGGGAASLKDVATTPTAANDCHCTPTCENKMGQTFVHSSINLRPLQRSA